MAMIHSDEFKRDAVRIATTSSLTRRQVASDLGVGLSTLNKWVKMVSDEAGPPDPDQNLLRENERLRRENRILKEERELPKMGETISAIGPRTMVEPDLRGPKAVKFAFLEDHRGGLSRAHACRVMGVTDRGLRAWKHRPVSLRQRRDVVFLAHIREQHRSSQGNAAVETFFKTLKAEMVWRRNWQTRGEVEVALFDDINGFYNPRRRHSASGWKSPVAFKRKAA